MSSGEKPQFDEQLVIRYLLGEVPEADAERLDELCVVDDEFAGRVTAVESDLVDASFAANSRRRPGNVSRRTTCRPGGGGRRWISPKR